MNATPWRRSSFCGSSACFVAKRDGDLVVVANSRYPDEKQYWGQDEWAGLLTAVAEGGDHVAIELLLASNAVWFGLPDHVAVVFDRDEWSAFVEGVRAGEFDFDRLSPPSPVPAASGEGSVSDEPGSSPDGAAAGEEGGSAPAAAVDVPAGRLTAAPAVLPPQEVGQPGLTVRQRVEIAVTRIVEIGGTPAQIAERVAHQLVDTDLLVDDQTFAEMAAYRSYATAPLVQCPYPDCTFPADFEHHHTGTTVTWEQTVRS